MDILIAEDEKDIAFSYKQALEERKHIVTITYNGEQCLKAYKDKLRSLMVNTEEIEDNISRSSNQLPYDVGLIRL